MGKRLLFVALLIGINIVQVLGQIDPDNLQNVNVDDMSDAQIEMYLERAAATGMTEQQLEQMARARGMSSAQISKLRKRIREVQSKSGSTETTMAEVGEDRSRQMPEKIDKPVEVAEGTAEEELELKVFGTDFFNNKKLSFEPSLNVATPQNYLLGPGDQVLIDIWGASEQSYQLPISPDGNVNIMGVGPIYLNGLTIEQADTKLKSKLRAIYSTLGSNTYAQVTLGKLRTIKVNVVGEVKQPGTYTLSSFATAFNALYVAGGPSENGSLRTIAVFRGGKKVTDLDAYSYIVEGGGENIALQDQDVILVQPYGIRVGINGEVKRPAYYEMLETETVADLVKFAGGFGMEAYTRSISLQRNEQNFKTVKTVFSGEFESLTLKNGDYAEVGVISSKFKGRVRVEGAVNHEGEYEFAEGMMLSELINAADGFRGDVFREQALIVRENGDFTLSNIAFSPKDLVEGGFDMELQSEDLIKVRSIFDLRENYNIKVQGEVRMPGEYDYFEGMTVENLIYLSGGFKQGAAKSFVEVARRIYDDPKGETYSAEIFNFSISANLKIDEEASNFVLEPFDLVVIRTSPFFNTQKMMEVVGEVEYPGKYVLEKKNERISDVLKRAGGLNQYAYAEGASLVRLSEYNPDSEESRDEVTEVKKQKLTALYQRDTLLRDNELDFKGRETIGIYLDEIVRNPGSKYDLILKEGDILNVPRQLETIKVRGKVLYPSTIHYDGSTSLGRYIAKAGGFGDRAMKRKIYVIYANGTAKKTKSFLFFKDYPTVTAGAEVIVPEKRERVRMTPGEWMGIATSLGTLALVINTLVAK